MNLFLAIVIAVTIVLREIPLFSLAQLSLARISTKQAETRLVSHPSSDTALLADSLEDSVLLLHASTHLGNLVVSGTVVARVPKAVAVCTILLFEPLKFLDQCGSRILHLRGGPFELNFTEKRNHGPALKHMLIVKL